MLNIEVTARDITTPGLYMMRWNKRVGLVRIVGDQRNGWNILRPAKEAVESYMTDLPENGKIPEDARFSEPLAIVNA